MTTCSVCDKHCFKASILNTAGLRRKLVLALWCHLITDCQELKGCTQVTKQHYARSAVHRQKAKENARHLAAASVGMSGLADGVALRHY